MWSFAFDVANTDREFDNTSGIDFSSQAVTAVPLPAGVLLLGSALGGLGLMGRRRKAA